MSQYESHSAVVHKYNLHFRIFTFSASYLGMTHKCMEEKNIYKISSFVFHGGKKVIQFWNDLRATLANELQLFL